MRAKLVNEAIKHLGSRSKKDIVHSLKSLTDMEIYNIWAEAVNNNDKYEGNNSLAYLCYNELSNREHSPVVEWIWHSSWHSNFKDYIKYGRKVNEAIKHLTPKSDEELKKVHEDSRRDLEDYLHAFGINIKEFDKLGITVTQIDGDNLVIEVYRVLIHKAWATSCYNHENAMKMIKAFKKYAMHNDRKFSIEKTITTIDAEYIKKQLKNESKISK